MRDLNGGLIVPLVSSAVVTADHLTISKPILSCQATERVCLVEGGRGLVVSELNKFVSIHTRGWKATVRFTAGEELHK